MSAGLFHVTVGTGGVALTTSSLVALFALLLTDEVVQGELDATEGGSESK